MTEKQSDTQIDQDSIWEFPIGNIFGFFSIKRIMYKTFE